MATNLHRIFVSNESFLNHVSNARLTFAEDFLLDFIIVDSFVSIRM